MNEPKEMDMTRDAVRKRLAQEIAANQESLIELAAKLVSARSENPPGDTDAAAQVAYNFLKQIPGIEIEMSASEPPITNLVARVRGGGTGRRLVFSGHLDTFPAGDLRAWSTDPFHPIRRQGRLYGRGVSDMKGGIACSLLAMEALARCRNAWRGEVVAVLAGDEETMGTRGTWFLLDTVTHASGDVVICGDAGSPRVLRFGEKGMVWLEVHAHGHGGHGAHVHLGQNAIERLIEAMNRLFELRAMPVQAPCELAAAIDTAGAISESLSGKGESTTLTSVTVNCGALHGGTSANLIPDVAHASLDIRLPAGVSVAQVEAAIADRLGAMEGISYEILRRYEPTWTAPSHEIISILKNCGREILGSEPVANMRVGASDTRLYRLRGMAAVVCGLTPHNMGRPDEYIDLDELAAVSHMHALAAFDYFSAEPAPERL